MTKEELYKVTDILNNILSNHLRGSETEEIIAKLEESIENSELIEEDSKKCMYARDNYTDEDRKVLCDGCEEKCEYAQKEADWLQELHCKIDSLSKEDFEKVWAKYHQKEEPINEDLEEAALLYYPKMSRISEPHDIIPADNKSHYLGDANEDNRKAFKAGANWREKQLMAKAVEVDISDNGCTKGLQFIPVWPFTDEYVGGDKVKLIIIKED